MAEGSVQNPPQRILARVNRFSFYIGLAYGVIILTLAIPAVQRHVTYQHALRFPLFAQYDTPEKYGLAPGKALNLQISTPDNVTLGAWFILSDPFHQKKRLSSFPSVPEFPVPPPTLETVRDAVRTHPTILYFHGNAATRAAPKRIQHYSSFTSRLQANVLVIDYRGFGDSSGTPDEPGLELDAISAWKWLIAQGARQEDILIVGHSLGTGVSSKLARHLAHEDAKPRGLVLLAPFSSLATLVETYAIFGLPILQPLQTISFGRKLLKRLLYHEFNTLAIIQDLNIPVMLAHSKVDKDIPHTHSQTLIDHLLTPLLPPATILPQAPGSSLSSEEFATFAEAHAKRKAARQILVRTTEIPNFGTIEEFDGQNGRVLYVETMWGAHDLVGAQEGIQDEIAKMFSLGVLGC